MDLVFSTLAECGEAFLIICGIIVMYITSKRRSK